MKENWGCNLGINPTGQDAFDGVTLSPYEVLFVKAKESLVLSAQTITIEAVKLESWLDWEVGLALPDMALALLVIVVLIVLLILLQAS
jgi:hypothetical protein